jgi:hypothetical protein
LCNGTICTPVRRTGQACNPGDYCFYGECVAGRCVEYGGEGDACDQRSANRHNCNADNWCDDQAGTQPGTCRPLGGQGAGCFNWFDCQHDLYCAGERTTPPVAAGACVARKTLDGVCSVWWECGDGLYCDTAAKRCRAEKPIGAACQSPIECAGACDISACWAPSCSNGVCQPAICVDPTP